jgi:hypothetical protein
MLLAVGTAGAASKHHSSGSVYTLTNSTAGNAVAVFERAKDGTLTPNGTYPTGGTGTGSNLGSQGAVILSENGHHLFAVNAGSNSISQFRVTHDGLDWQATVPSGGASPISLTLHGRVLYVLNAGGAGNISGFVAKRNGLTPLAGSTRPLGAGSAGPAQVSFAPNGKTLVVTEKASSTIDTYAVGPHGVAGPPIVNAAIGGTPFGFDFDKARQRSDFERDRIGIVVQRRCRRIALRDQRCGRHVPGCSVLARHEHERPLRVHRERR